MKLIPLTQGRHAIVDDEDYDWLMTWKWFAKNNKGRFYAATNDYNPGRRQRVVSMHRMLLVYPCVNVVDHINGDSLDNQKENLRIVTNRQNCNNRKSLGTSNYPGVSWNTKNRRWYAFIQLEGKQVFLGSFKDELKAYLAYCKACPEPVLLK